MLLDTAVEFTKVNLIIASLPAVVGKAVTKRVENSF